MKKIPIIAVLVSFLAGAVLAGSFVAYSVRWEQNETEWCEVTVYGQGGSVYLDYNSSWRPQLTINFPADIASVVGLQMIQAAKDTRSGEMVSHE